MAKNPYLDALSQISALGTQPLKKKKEKQKNIVEQMASNTTMQPINLNKDVKYAKDPNIRHTQEWAEKTLPKPLAIPLMGYGKIMDDFSQTKAGRFSDRTGEAAVKTMMFDETPSTNTTGSKGLDVTADMLGMGLGFITPGGPASGALKAGAQGGKMASRVLPQTGKVAKYGPQFLEGAGAGAAYATGRGLANDKPFDEIAKDAVIEAALFGGLDVAGRAAWAGLKGLRKKPQADPIDMLSEVNKAYTIGKANAPIVQHAKPKFAHLEGGINPKPSKPDFFADPFGNVSNTKIAGLLPEPKTPKPKAYKAPDRQAAFKEAQQEYDDAVVAIQDYLQHNDVLANVKPGTTIEEAIAQAEKAAGVDLQGALKRLEQAEAMAGTNLTGELAQKSVGLDAATRHVLGPKLQKPKSIPEKYVGEMDWRLGKPEARPIPELLPKQPSLKKEVANIAKPKQPATTINLNLFGELAPKGPLSIKQIKQPRKHLKLADEVDVNNLRDISGFRGYTTDVYRNFRDVFGKHYQSVKARVLDPFDASKKANVELQEKWLNNLKTEVVDKLGIQKGSKLSELVQKYGEKQITEAELRKLAPKDVEKIKAAEKWFRKAYDEIIDQVNEVRAKIYPGQKDKIVPKRKDYFRHFQEFTELSGLKNVFETPSFIDPSLVGVSEFTRPKAKWASFMQKRGMGPFKNDAVGGFLDYVPAASYSIHIDPHIGKFQKLRQQLATATGEQGTNTKHLNNFLEFLDDYARDLSGKTNPADRFVQKIIPGGRMTFKAVNWLNNRVKANVILGNVASSLSQIANIPQGVAFAKQYSVKGAGKTMASIFTKNEPLAKSGFMKERYGGYGSKLYRQFDTGWLNQPKKFAQWVLETSDRIGTTFIWNSTYEKAVAEGIKNPVKYADDMTRSLVAGRGVGEVPLLQKSKLFQIAAPFQLEVGNLWQVQRDFVKRKDFGALATLYLASYLFNKGMEQVRGSGVVFDPIDAMIDAFSEDDISIAQRGGRLAGEVLSNVPLGQSVAAAVVSPGSREKVFGKNDPTRYGAGLLPDIARNVTSAAMGQPLDLTDPAFKLALSWGGGQVKKSFSGAMSAKNEGVYNKLGFGDELRYPVKPDPKNITKGLIFGPSGFKESKKYYDERRKPLSKNQTLKFEQLIKQGKDPEQTYESLMVKRRVETLKKKARDIAKDEKLTEQEKKKQIAKLKAEYDRLMK